MAPKGKAQTTKIDLRLSDDKTVPFSIGLKQSEVAELTELAKSLGIARNALGVFIVRHGIAELKAKRLKIPIKRVSVIDMPD